MEYSISYSAPHKQLIDIQFWAEIQGEETLELKLPAWRPGRYELQNYASQILNFKAVTENLLPLEWYKTDRNTWSIVCKSFKKIKVSYSFYANKADAGGSWLDENLLYVNPINCILCVKGREEAKYKLTLKIDSSFRIASGLEQQSLSLTAENYLHLVDSPFFASPSLQSHSFEVDSVKFSLHFAGECRPDFEVIEKQFKAFINAQMALFGSFPEKDYHFLFLILPYKYYHGVEHRNSTVIVLGSDSPNPVIPSETLGNTFLGISSHELFHAWNICKIRPKEMLPYNLERENYFSTGFVAEGVTTYYGDLMLLRGGVWGIEQYFKELSDNINLHFHNQARNKVSLLQTSIDLWVDGYQKTHPHRKVSIYDKGALVAFLLDIEIRKATENKYSLDDVMRALWHDFALKNKGYIYQDYKNIVNTLTKSPLEKYFSECIEGTMPLDRWLAKALDYIGCIVSVSNSPLVLEYKFGLKLRQENDKVSVLLTENGSPADKVLAPHDELIEVNGSNLPQEWQKLHETNSLQIKLKRAGKVLNKTLYADGASYFPVYNIRLNEQRTEQQIKNFLSWSRNTSQR